MALSPMMQQYMRLKERYRDCLLFFRVGDFYEMFFEDAKLVSRELELTLTGKDCGLEERAPMCGVPHHAVNTYVEKLVNLGYRVAIGEQMEDPQLAKGLVERDVTRIFTPGTLSDPSMLDERANRYLLSLCLIRNQCGLAYVDVSTGEFLVHRVSVKTGVLADEVERIHPSEIICNHLTDLRALLPGALPPVSEPGAAYYQASRAESCLLEHFHLKTLASIGLNEEDQCVVNAAGALMRYLDETQKNALEHITHLQIAQSQDHMLLDRNTRRNLELTENLQNQGRKGTLLWLLDKTCTAMGSRLLRSWIEQPLIRQDLIQNRLDSVACLTQNHVLREQLAELLTGVYDIERLLSKVSYRTVNARDCLALRQSLEKIPEIRRLLDGITCGGMESIRMRLDPLADVTARLQRAIDDDAPLLLSEGGMIRSGYHAGLDELRDAATHGRQWILDLEASERERTGIRNLKVQYNRVFGYYIEVTKSFLAQVPADYIRKQTLTNAERFMTPALKEMEQRIIGAQEQAIRLELTLFQEIRDLLTASMERIQGTASALKELDALLSLARAATEYGYIRPQIREDGELEIREGRHPVVEQTLREDAFVPNDTHMDQDQARMLIITGPNMAGKSTYMRQVALIVLMAHIGSFVPAQSASVPIVDRIFTRIGASDDLAGGQSTFMMEMSETAYILKNATRNSLLILDEIGRGTSTFDGLAIAWAVVEYLCDREKCGAKTLFATHYHELSELEGHLDGVQNYCISVREQGEDILFLRKIIRGGADRSFGIQVARLAGVPRPVLVRAHEIQARLEVSDINQNAIGQNILGQNQERKKPLEQMDLFNFQRMEIIEELQKMDVMAMTPMDAMNQLFLLREKARNL